jgi:hypothetical protein
LKAFFSHSGDNLIANNVSRVDLNLKLKKFKKISLKNQQHETKRSTPRKVLRQL